MKHYRPLLFQELDVRMPGVRVKRLRLNRHLPEVDAPVEHVHTFSQILYYLGGRGTMQADGRKYEIGPGSVVFLPPRCLHAFSESSARRPLCLVLDLDWRGAVKQGLAVGRLSLSEAGGMRRELSELTRLSEPNSPECRLIVASVVLRLLDGLFRGLGILAGRQRETPSFVRQFDRLIRQEGMPQVAAVAAQMGYQPDYLNRIFKQATGQTLREYRDAFLIERAKRLLNTRSQIREACEELGFLDQNYFARWFKKHTGLQPRAFRVSHTS